MKSFLFGTAALTTLCLSLPALAADLPARVTKAPPVLVSPALRAISLIPATPYRSRLVNAHTTRLWGF